jgi:hypothetical protein
MFRTADLACMIGGFFTAARYRNLLQTQTHQNHLPIRELCGKSSFHYWFSGLRATQKDGVRAAR